MFIQFKKLNNESGIILFVSLMTAVIIIIFSICMWSQSMNELNYAQQQIDQITADQLSQGVFWNEYAAVFSANSPVQMPLTNVMVGPRQYQVSMVNGSLINGVTSYNISTTYDTFQ